MTTMTNKKRPSGKKAQTRKTAPNVERQENEALPSIDSEQRYGMIAEAAYLIAEQRGFQGEAAMDDWLQAEADVDARFPTGTQVSHQV